MVKTLDKTITIIEALSEVGPAGTVALADATGFPRSTIHHHLSKLEEYDLVVNQDGMYRLSLRFFDIGERVRRGIELYEIALWELDELADEIGCSTRLVVAENKSAIPVYQAGESTGVPVSVQLGEHLPLHATAAGKALLTVLTDSDDYEFLRELSLSSYTEQTITDTNKLTTELEAAAERGYTVSEEERWNDRFSVAVPVPETESGAYPAAIEIELTTEQYDKADVNQIAAQAQQTANVIDIKSSYSG